MGYTYKILKIYHYANLDTICHTGHVLCRITSILAKYGLAGISAGFWIGHPHNRNICYYCQPQPGRGTAEGEFSNLTAFQAILLVASASLLP